MKKLICTLSVLFVVACSENIKESKPKVVTPPSKSKDYIISSYIRPEFYENFDRITDENLLSNNDLIFFAASPFLNGDIMYQFPDNSIKDTKKIKYLENFKERNGVISFSGADSYANVGKDLLNSTYYPIVQFTFGAWVYIKQWSPNAAIFVKGDNITALSLGETPLDLNFSIDGVKATSNLSSTNFKVGEWHHIGLVYNGSRNLNDRVQFFVDGKRVNTVNVPNNFPNKILSTETDENTRRADVKLGKGFNGYLDEVFFNKISLEEGTIKHFMDNGIALRNTGWYQAKTWSYWKFDDASNQGKDEQSWKILVQEIKNKITQSGKNIKLRLGLNTGGSEMWKKIMADPLKRNHFAQQVANLVAQDGWDGVDFDFEWCSNPKEYSDYSKAIIETGKRIKDLSGNKIFSVSLHPVSFRISKEAIENVDFFSFQLYGPSPSRFPYTQFVSDTEMITNYGFPKEKTVLGVPFYGTRTQGRGIQAYYTFVKAGLITSPDLDKVVYNGHEYIFDGQTTIKKEAEYIKNNNYKGLMSWDLATDVSITNPWSLQKVVNDVLGNSK